MRLSFRFNLWLFEAKRWKTGGLEKSLPSFFFCFFFFVSHSSFNRGLLNALVFLQTFTKATIMRNKNKREVMKFERSEQFVNYSLEDWHWRGASVIKSQSCLGRNILRSIFMFDVIDYARAISTILPTYKPSSKQDQIHATANIKTSCSPIHLLLPLTNTP